MSLFTPESCPLPMVAHSLLSVCLSLLLPLQAGCCMLLIILPLIQSLTQHLGRAQPVMLAVFPPPPQSHMQMMLPSPASLGTHTHTFLFLSPPSSKCLHLLMASILLDLQLGSTHSSLSTIFFVVLAWGGGKSNEQCPKMNKMLLSGKASYLHPYNIHQLVLRT